MGQQNERVAMKRLRNRSRVAAVACRVAALGMPFLVLIGWISGTATGAIYAENGLPTTITPTTAQVWAAGAIGLLPAVALSLSLLAAARCFAGFAADDWFVSIQPRALAASGRWLLVSGLLGLVMPTVLGLILTLNAAPGERMLVISLSSTVLTACLFGALIWALGRVWETARAVAAENAQFV